MKRTETARDTGRYSLGPKGNSARNREEYSQGIQEDKARDKGGLSQGYRRIKPGIQQDKARDTGGYSQGYSRMRLRFHRRGGGAMCSTVPLTCCSVYYVHRGIEIVTKTIKCYLINFPIKMSKCRTSLAMPCMGYALSIF
jgi:hypothetical protein